jgi:hypothetical protein
VEFVGKLMEVLSGTCDEEVAGTARWVLYFDRSNRYDKRSLIFRWIAAVPLVRGRASLIMLYTQLPGKEMSCDGYIEYHVDGNINTGLLPERPRTGRRI